MRQKLLAGIYDGRPFRKVLRDLGLTSNQVWGLTKTDQEWSKQLEAALTAARRDDFKHGTNAAYVAGLCLHGVPGSSRGGIPRLRHGVLGPEHGLQPAASPSDTRR
jgi:hypothetical protein